jgi:colanic acid/amylovoran biosynthesis glycosyltransferase
MAHSFAYLYERFPSFVQTFVHREAMEMVRQGMDPWLVSIRHPEDPGDVVEQIDADIFYLPEADAMRAEIDAQIAGGRTATTVRKMVAEWRKLPDSNRVFEAAWLGPRLREKGITHIHAHFGGMAARTAWMLKKLYGFTYSFTGHANDIFCENDFARRWMEEKYPFARGRIVRVFNGVATDGFAPRVPSGPVPRIVSVGRSVEKKGFADLIEACRLLRERGRAFECAIVGGGPLDTILQTRIERANLSAQVQLLGPRPQGEVRELLASSHVFALASVPEGGGGSDNLPTVIAEAMLAGLPVVSTRVAGIPEMITDGESGFLVSPKDPAALAAAIEKVLADPVLAHRLGVRGRESAVEKFAIEKTVGALKHLLVRRCGVRPPVSARQLDPLLGRPWWARFFAE